MAPSTSPRWRGRARVGAVFAASAALVAGAVALLSGPAGSAVLNGPDPSTCHGDLTISFGTPAAGSRADYRVATFELPELSIVTQRTFDLLTSVVAGTYNVGAVTYDGFDGRDTWVVEPNERVTFDFLDSAGNVLATTKATVDLADSVIEATWSGSVGQVSWAGAPATKIRVVHIPQVPGDDTYNKVDPICLGLTAPAAATTTSATSTTVPARATTTTITVPTQVEAAVELPVAQPAAAQVAQPRFTG